MNNIPQKDYDNLVGLAKKYWLRSFAYIELDDLIQEGLLAYLKELKKYDKTKNSYFFGYAYKRIVGAMLDYIAANSVYGASTVRNIEPSKTSKIVTMPAEFEERGQSYEDELVCKLEKEKLFDLFHKYLEDLTELERKILTLYFVNNRSMVSIGTEVEIGRLKVKRIIVSCVTYLKKRYNLDLTVELDFKSLSKVYDD